MGEQRAGLLRELVGYGWSSRTGALSGRSTPIVLGENRYRIGDMVLLYAHSGGLIPLLVSPPGALVFHLVGQTNRNAELTATEREGLALHVCDVKFDFSDAARPGGTGPGEVVPSEPEYAGYDRHYLWENAGLIWLAGGARTLTLSLPAAADSGEGRTAGPRASIGDGEATGTIGASTGPAALTASFLAVPPEHDGTSPFELEFRLSEEPPGLSYRTVHNGLFDVSGGTIARAWRLQKGSNAGWGLRVEPSGFGDVTLALRATTDCAGTPGVCTSDGRMLGGGLQAVIAGPAHAVGRRCGGR